MNKFLVFIITIISLSILSCTTMVIPQQSSNLEIKKINPNEIKLMPDNIFFTGYYFENNYVKDKNSISVNLTDAICYYQIYGEDNFKLIPVKPLFFDLSVKNQKSILPVISNIHDVNFPIDDWIFAKIKAHDLNYSSIIMKSLINISRTDFEYNDDSFNKTGLTDISYMLRLQRTKKTPSLIFNIADSIAEGMPFLGDIIYVEAFTKNITINRVELKSELLTSMMTDEYKFIRWDFKEFNDENVLIIYYDTHPGRVPFVFDLKVSGLYKKK